jgi:hypothetical protein
LKGIRHLMREFTAMSVKEHLRSQVEDTNGTPELTKREVELVRFVLDRPSRWGPQVDVPASQGGDST